MTLQDRKGHSRLCHRMDEPLQAMRGYDPAKVSSLNCKVQRGNGLQAGPNLTFGELAKRLIDRWENMLNEQTRPLKHLTGWKLRRVV